MSWAARDLAPTAPRRGHQATPRADRPLASALPEVKRWRLSQWQRMC
jgi:hypothetical protein